MERGEPLHDGPALAEGAVDERRQHQIGGEAIADSEQEPSAAESETFSEVVSATGCDRSD